MKRKACWHICTRHKHVWVEVAVPTGGFTWSSTSPCRFRLSMMSPSFRLIMNKLSSLPPISEYSTSELGPSSASLALTVTTTWPEVARFHNTTSAASSLALFSPEVDVGVIGGENTGALSFSSRIWSQTGNTITIVIIYAARCMSDSYSDSGLLNL